MNAPIRFQFDDDYPVRITRDDDGDLWFVLADVCNALELSSPHKVADRLKDRHKGWSSIPTPGGPQQMTVINEPGLYRTIFRSRKPNAERFQDWVFEQVLPQIRRSGRYEPQNRPESERRRAALSEREVHHPDGRKVIERYDTGHTVHQEVTVSPGAALEESRPPDVTPEIPVEELRQRFHQGLISALPDLHEYRRLRSEDRGTFQRQINRKLKAFIGKKRDDWDRLDYSNAVNWLLINYSLNIRWVLEAPGEGNGS